MERRAERRKGWEEKTIIAKGLDNCFKWQWKYSGEQLNRNAKTSKFIKFQSVLWPLSKFASQKIIFSSFKVDFKCNSIHI